MRRWYRSLPPLLALAGVGFASVAQAAPQVGISGWEWSHPLPQGETLLDVGIADATHAYAVGDAGTILTTADGGGTWSAVPGGVTTDLSRVATISASSFVTAGNCLARRSDDGGTTLKRLRFSPREDSCTAPIAAASFATANDGVLLLQDGTVLTTADGGVTFARPGNVEPGSSQPPTDVLMMSSTVGLATTANGTILRTTNGGGSWTPVFRSPTPILDVTAADGSTFYAAGGNGLFKSTDGGVTWTTRSAAAQLQQVRCASTDLCLLVTSNGALLRTADGGATTTAPAAFPGGVKSIGFFSATRAVAVGTRGRTALSDDGGATWRTVGRSIDSGVYGVQADRNLGSLRANPDGVAYAFGSSDLGTITADRGATWRVFGVPTTSGLQAVSFASKDAGFALDNAGTLFGTANGGNSWQILDIPGNFTAVDVQALTAQNLIVVGSNGDLRRSTNGGQTFASAGTPAVRRLAGQSGRAGNAFALYGTRGIAVSSNGAVWRVIKPPNLAGKARAMRASRCTSVTVCWAVTTDGKLYRTVNAGKAWLDRSAGVGRYPIDGLAPANRNRAYITVRTGFPTSVGYVRVLYTTDGGATWTPEPIGTSVSTPSIAPSTGIDFAIDLDGNLFTTTTGGLRTARSVVSLNPTPRTITRATKITVRGRLTPAVGGEQVVISAGKRSQTVTVESNGRFSATFTVSATTTFVAQWGGDRNRSGDGSPAVTVRRR
jgi:photosystem II stability/assembly factor-like uncharacterized protein